jgi:hypothetical protein
MYYYAINVCNFTGEFSVFIYAVCSFTKYFCLLRCRERVPPLFYADIMNMQVNFCSSVCFVHWEILQML